jgi:chaperonin GroEL
MFEASTEVGTQKLKKPIVIISDNIDTGILNKLTQLVGLGQNVVAIKSPSYGSRRQDIMKDLSILLGCKVYTKETCQEVTEDGLGVVSSVICDANRTLITGGKGSKEDISNRIASIKKQRQKETVKKEKTFLEERIAKLSGGIALIKVGGYSSVEVNEKIDRVTDALHATKACLEEGFVAGGGVTLLMLQSALKELKNDQKSIQKGIDILTNALGYPFKQLLRNAGLDSDEYLDRISNSAYGFGVNVDNEEFVDLFSCGVIDPTKVVRVSLESACSVASTFLSTGGIVYNDENILQNAEVIKA